MIEHQEGKLYESRTDDLVAYVHRIDGDIAWTSDAYIAGGVLLLDVFKDRALSKLREDFRREYTETAKSEALLAILLRVEVNALRQATNEQIATELMSRGGWLFSKA